MVFFKEEINAFNHTFFDNACCALDTEKGMNFYCRDTFWGTKGIVPNSDKDALARITHGLRVQYMFETKNKIGRWGIVDVPEALIDECAGRIFAKVIVRRPLQTEEEAARKAMEEAVRKAMEEAARKAMEEAARKAGKVSMLPLSSRPQS